jgi:DNA-binding response OmpR family regulator
MPLKIYYVDDEPALLEMFVDTFSSPDLEITVFEDPKKAIAAIKASPPDLLFLDFRLPNTTGDKLALSIDPNIPKALISGDLSIKCEAKFDAYFEKPYKSSDVEAFIRKYLGVKKAA